MNIDNLSTIDQLRDFLGGSQPVAFNAAATKDERYRFIQRTLVKFSYLTLGRCDKGVVIRFLLKVSGYSRAQLTRLIGQYRKTGKLVRGHSAGNGFARKYTREDVGLLVKLDGLHDKPNGMAVKKLAERACEVYGDERYRNLAGASVSQIYRMRNSKRYRNNSLTLEKTRPRNIPIGERRKPQPNGQPGYIRIDTVHQGDLDKAKGVYHVNAVDAVTQMQVMASVEGISERYLIPALEELLNAFPFVVQGFHSDNGSEYVNKQVASLLGKLNIEFTKSRARKSNDNALVEGKNGHVVRKLFGHGHIAQKWAVAINEFNSRHANPYNNYHRPCMFAQEVIGDKGKVRKTYPYELMMTPYEKFKSLPDASSFLKPGLTFKKLDAIAHEVSDSLAAERLQEARQQLFDTIHGRGRKRA